MIFFFLKIRYLSLVEVCYSSWPKIPLIMNYGITTLGGRQRLFSIV